MTANVHWAAKHWSQDENPGMGDEGLFYFYNVLSKSLAKKHSAGQGTGRVR